MPTRTASDKVLRDKALNVAKNVKYDEYQCGLASMVYELLDTKGYGANTEDGVVKSEIM